MASLSLTCKPWPNTFSLYSRKTPAFSLRRQAERLDFAPRAQTSSSLLYNPLSLRSVIFRSIYLIFDHFWNLDARRRGSLMEDFCALCGQVWPFSFRFSLGNEGILRGMKTKKRGSRGSGAVCYAAPLSARHLQWISIVSSA